MNLSSPVSPRVKILVVDDHPNTAVLLARAISQLGTGVEVVSATSGRQALERVRRHGAADILITDMNMPEMTGLELIEKLHEQPGGCPTFSFLLTACDAPGLKAAARRLDIREVLRKPVHPQVVCQIVSQALEEMEQSRPYQELETQKRFRIPVADGQLAREADRATIAHDNPQIYNKPESQQGQLATVLQSAADAILMFDAGARLTLVNLAGQKLFTDYEAKLGQRLSAGAGYDSFLQLLDQARLFNAPISGEVVWPDQRVFSASITPVPGGGCFVVLHDVSRFKELEKVKNEFVATASHDLRNPLTSIIGFSLLIQQVGPLNDPQNDFIQRIQYAAANMSELVENLLNLTKFDLGVETRRDKVDVMHLLWEVAGEIGFQAEMKGQSLTIEKIELDTKVLGDALQIRQALRNLIGNAVKYTPAGGVIRLSLEHESNMAKISIKDTGYGIPSSDLPHIFDRFYRVRDNGHDQIDGNGLGLAIVKSIAEGHGGDVTVESEVGQGTCFTLKLPLVQTENISANSHITEMKIRS
ncbi:MAG TPA: ATP-binding protein [Anaerolineales bacterium]|nr:ATP-binding protein [Anaerolineales bacterium]